MEFEQKVSENSVNNDNNSNKSESKTFPKQQFKHIEDIVKKEGYIKHEVDIKIISTDGGNYLGDLYEVDIKGETANGYKETNIFVKIIIPNQSTMFSITDIYYKEFFIYTEISKIFNVLQNDANIPEDERLNIAKSYDATNTDAIFMENLGKEGFSTLHRMDVMPLRFAKLAVQQLARFHGLFHIIQRKRPDYFGENLKKLRIPFIFNEEWRDFMHNLCNLTIKGLNEETKLKVEKYIENICDKIIYYFEDDSSPGCTICHGDYKVNNILAKKCNGQFTKAVPVDFQILYYGCPINDLLNLIFTASDREFRKNHLTDLKDFYYDNLTKYLNYFHVDMNDFLPRKEFERLYKEKLELGLIFSLYCTPFNFTKDDHVPDIAKDDVRTLGFVLDSRYEERIQGIVDDFIQWGYL